MNEDTTQVLDRWAERLVEAMDAASGPAAELALATARVEAVQELVWGVVGLVVLGAVAVGVRWAWSILSSMPDNRHGEWPEVKVASTTVMLMVATIVAVVTLSRGVTRLFNAMAWVGVFHPEIWLAHQVLEAMR